MYCRAIIICMLIGLGQTSYASGVTAYGMGLTSCKDYATAQEQQGFELVAFTDWLSGYLSGVNTTSTHRNNFLSHEDLESAMDWLYEYCRAHPTPRLVEASWALVAGAKTGAASHSVEVTAYGSGYKSCAVYRQAQQEQSIELNVDRTEFVAWLGGYLSGVNAMSLATGNALGNAALSDAVRWLDGYCDAHAQTSFGEAVQALIVEDRSTKADAALASVRSPAEPGSGAGSPATRVATAQ